MEGFWAGDGTWVTGAERARWARSSRAWVEAETIADRYRADREGCKNRNERGVVWRTYCRAMLDEQAERITAGRGIFASRNASEFVRWRKSRDDRDLPVRWTVAWSRMSDDELLDLEEALIRARYRG